METRRDFIRGALAAGLLAPAIDANARDYFDQTQYKLKTPPQPKGMQNPIQAQPITLTQEQRIATVRQLIGELNSANYYRNTNDTIAQKSYEDSFTITNFDISEDMLPILIGKNVVFSKKWLAYIDAEDKAKLTQEEFGRWRDNADRVYDAYAELVGQLPQNRTKVIISCWQTEKKPLRSNENIIYSGTLKTIKKSFEQIKPAGCDYSMLDQLANIFMNGRKWKGDNKQLDAGWKCLMIAYALEKKPVRYNNEYSGEQYREKAFNYAQEIYDSNQMKESSYGYPGSAFEYYLLGFVDKVGWEPYKKAFKSYDDKSTSYKPKSYNNTNKDMLTARDFFDRVEHFSGQENLLKSLKDEGSFFKVTEVKNTTPSLRDRFK